MVLFVVADTVVDGTLVVLFVVADVVVDGTLVVLFVVADTVVDGTLVVLFVVADVVVDGTLVVLFAVVCWSVIVDQNISVVVGNCSDVVYAAVEEYAVFSVNGVIVFVWVVVTVKLGPGVAGFFVVKLSP